MNLSPKNETVPTDDQQAFSHLAVVLHSAGPSPELGDVSMLYDWLIGSWDLRIIDYLEDGSLQISKGEWHFGWVLEGRAIQDVFIAPPLHLRSASTPKKGNRYGATFRTYDRTLDTWHITWFNPVSGIESRLVGKKTGNEIVHEGKNSDGSLMRWTFSEIQPDSFRWTGEHSTDQGLTWHVPIEISCVRRKT